MTYDICANRHGGNAQSIAANERVTPKKLSMREEILLVASWKSSFTLANVAVLLDKPKHAISGRISELLKSGHIERTGDVYDGHAVYRLRRI